MINMLEGIDWKLVAILIPICMALTEWVKVLSKNKLGQWAIAVSMGMAFLTVFLFGIGNEAFNTMLFAKMSIMVGLGACGLYNTTTQVGYGSVRAVEKGIIE